MSSKSGHGGNIYQAAKEHGFSEEQIIDYSGNINPLGVPRTVKEAIIEKLDMLSIYPDPEYHSLKKVVSEYVNTSQDNIIIGNGATELISLFIKSIKPQKAMLISPAYSEYEREVTLLGGQVIRYRLKEELSFKLDIDNLLEQLKMGVDLLIICNPNNPTGQAIYLEEMRKILGFCRANDIFVMIDETYVEFTRNIEKVTSIPLINEFNNLFIIRGVSKFFSAPGLRLGYGVVSSKELRKSIEDRKDPWSANTMAVVGGEALFTDYHYMDNAKRLINEEREYVTSFLKELPYIKVFEPDSNFVLCKIVEGDVRADYLKRSLLEKGMLIRDASSFPFLDNTFFRVCFLTRDQNKRLLEELVLIFNKGVV